MGIFRRGNKNDQPIIIDADETYEESLQREANQLRDKIDRHVAQSNLQDQIRRDQNEEKMQTIRNRWKRG